MEAGLGTMDFETRSACDLRKHGAWNYSKHETTSAMCLSYSLPWYEEDQVSRWHMAHPNMGIEETPLPEDLFKAIEEGYLFEAHNSFFEWCIWNNLMVPKHGWPKIPQNNWRCSAAKASAAALPRELAAACDILQLPVRKNMAGHRLMLKMCKPRKPRKAEIEQWQYDNLHDGTATQAKLLMPIMWHEDPEELEHLWQYCDEDVLAEKCLSANTKDLSDFELKVWQMDQRMNQKGVMIDRELCTAALKMSVDWKAKLNAELYDLTGILRGSMRQQCKEWLVEWEKVELPDTTADTLEWYIENEDISGRARRVIEIMREVNKTSTAKYQKMINMADPDDDRVRDIMRYCGAERTGRWAGAGIQVHNFPARDLIVKDMSFAAEIIKSGDLDWCEAMYSDIMKLLSHSLRGALIPTPGTVFAIADYAAIEARIILWLAEQMDALEVFYRGEDIYSDMATGIYGYTVIKGTHLAERQFGKQAILGLGFGMGWITFLLTCKKYKIKFSVKQVSKILGKKNFKKYMDWVERKLYPKPEDSEDQKTFSAAKREASRNRRRLTDERLEPRKLIHELALMKYTTDVYRSRYPEVKSLWKDLEVAAIEAVQSGEPQRVRRVTFFTEGDYLYCELPSKRLLSYLHPKVSIKKTPWGTKVGHLSYIGPHPKTKQPTRIGTYGGKLAENITQATARDAMADSMVNADADDVFDLVMSIHDELVSEVAISLVEDGIASLKSYSLLMNEIGDWAKGCPIVAEAEFSPRYKK